MRCFGSPAQTLDLSDSNGKHRQWTILLGDNGTGKTTLLECLEAMTPDESSGLGIHSPRIAETFIIDGRKWKLHKVVDNRIVFNMRLVLEVNQKAFQHTIFVTKNRHGSLHGGYNLYIAQNLVCFAYGASRQIGKTLLSGGELISYRISFSDEFVLLNPEEWLLQADYAASRDSEFKEKRKEELELVKRILINTLPDVDDIRFAEKESGRTPQPIVEFHTHYGWVESKDLSLGYRTSMAWIVDFASRMFERYPESENPLEEPAIVLIDEIDLHLHPKWQRDLIDYLTNLFPNTQFIVTTHSPLIVQAAAARDANLVVLRREGDHVVIDQSIEAVRGWRTDQILTSDLFDLPSARPKETEELLEQRKQILSKAKLTKADEKKLKEISEKLGSLPVMENPEDDKAMDIIRRAAAHLQQEKR